MVEKVFGAMRKSFIALAILIVFYCPGLSKKHHRHHRHNRIYGGDDVKEAEFPYVVYLRANLMSCSGSLISNKFVLTAAHCLMYLSKGDEFVVVLGDIHSYLHTLNLPPPNGTLRITARMNFWKHEKFTMPLANDDVGLVELPNPVDFTPKIQPLKLSKDPFVDKPGQLVTVTLAGFGLAGTDLEVPDVMQKAKMKLVPIEECMKFQPNFVETVTKDHICAKGLHHVVSPCDIDSGAI